MVRRGDHDGVEVLRVRAACGSRGYCSGFVPIFFDGEVEVRLVDVADGDDLAVLVRQERVEHLVAAIAEADEPDADAVVGAIDAGGAQRGRPAADVADLVKSRRVIRLIACSRRTRIQILTRYGNAADDLAFNSACK